MKQLQIDELYGRALYEYAGLVLICGSRTARREHLPLIRAELSLFPKSTSIIHGGQGTYNAFGKLIGGADMLADEVARGLGLKITVIYADWIGLGRAAGPRRNSAMLRERPGLVLAFWDGASRGTLDAITKARQLGIPVRVVEISN